MSELQKYDDMPEGWRIDTSWGSPEHGYAPICNGKSMLNGGKKGLLLRNVGPVIQEPCRVINMQVCAPVVKMTKDETREAAEVTNKLAREKFKEKLLQEILFDMSVCKIEGWPIKQYATELKMLIDSVVLKFENKDGALETAEGRGTACNSASMQVALDI